MDLKVFHDTVRYFLNIEQGGWLSPEEIDNIADRAQMWLYGECLPYYGKSQKETDYLAPFYVRQAFTSTSGGIVSLPIDPDVDPCYLALPTVTVTYNDSVKTRYKPVKLLAEDELGERLDSQLLEPTTTDPVGEETVPGTIKIYPATTYTGYTTYLRRPLKPEFSYTQDGRTLNYREGYSTQLEWTETAINKILIKTLQMFGVNLSEEMIIQYTEAKNQQDI